MAAQQRADRGRPRRRRRAGGVLVVLIAAWLAGRGFMAGRGAMPDAGAQQTGGAAADATVREQTPVVAATPGGESKANAANVAVDATDIAPDRIAALCDAVHAELARGDLAMAAESLQRARAASPGAEGHDEFRAADAAARAAAVARCAEAIALLQQGRAIRAHALLVAFLPSRRHAADALFLLPEPLQAAVQARCGGRLRDGELAPSPRPIGRGRTVTAWRDGQAVTGVCVAGDAEQATLRVVRDETASFPMVPYASCEPIDPSAAEAIECGFAAARAGDAGLAASWLLVAELRGGGASERGRRLAGLLQ